MEKRLEVLRIVRPIARVGTADNGIKLTKEHIKDVLETFSPGHRVPVIIGHPKEAYLRDDIPAHGHINKIWSNKDYSVLYAELDITSPYLREAYENGLFESVSVGIRKKPESGKHYLHHLAFVTVPAFKDLNQPVVNASDLEPADLEEFDDVECFEFAENIRFKSYAKTDWPIADNNTSWDADGAKRRLLNKGGKKLLAKCCGAVEFHNDEKELPDAVSRYRFPFCDVIDGQVKIVPKAVASGIAYLHGARGVKVNESLAKVVRHVFEKLRNKIEKAKKKEASDMATIEIPKEEWEKIQQEREALKKQMEEYQKHMREMKAKEIIQMAEGKVPKDKLALVGLLANAVDFDRELEFADDNGKRKLTAFELLKEIFNAIPNPVQDTSSFDFSDKDREEVSHYEVMDRI